MPPPGPLEILIILVIVAMFVAPIAVILAVARGAAVTRPTRPWLRYRPVSLAETSTRSSSSAFDPCCSAADRRGIVRAATPATLPTPVRRPT
ncbi:MAG: hypothetical protein ACSLFN_15900 [Candidatus Limnocylindrales bacterium]